MTREPLRVGAVFSGQGFSLGFASGPPPIWWQRPLPGGLIPQFVLGINLRGLVGRFPGDRIFADMFFATVGNVAALIGSDLLLVLIQRRDLSR